MACCIDPPWGVLILYASPRRAEDRPRMNEDDPRDPLDDDHPHASEDLPLRPFDLGVDVDDARYVAQPRATGTPALRRVDVIVLLILLVATGASRFIRLSEPG